jgi:hypothetical protein
VLIDTGTNKLFVRRNARGTSFKKVVDTGRSIARDKRRKAQRKVRDRATAAVDDWPVHSKHVVGKAAVA